jgi:hypothetical protein
VERTRATWTDERLDDLSRRVDQGFERMDRGFERVDGRIDALQRTMVQSAVAIISANLVVTITLIAALA